MSLSIALLGAGIFATEAHLPALATLRNSVTLTAVYSRSLSSATALAKAAHLTLSLPSPPAVYHDADPAANLPALLARKDIAAVIVLLPISIQPAIVLQALAAGKHVLSEKPVAKDVASARALIAAYDTDFKHTGLVWRVAENYEAEPGYRAAARAIRAGKIGDVAFFKLSAVNYIDKDSKWYKTPWRTVPDYQGGFLLDGGVHSAALLRILLPSPLTHLTGLASLTKDFLAPHDTLHALLRAADGAHGILELSFAAPAPSRAATGNSTLVTGTRGWLEVASATVDGARVVRVTIRSVRPDGDGGDGGGGGDAAAVPKEDTEVIDEPVRGIEAELASFAAAVAGADDGLGDPRSALADVAVIQAALDSHGQLVDLQKLVAD